MIAIFGYSPIHLAVLVFASASAALGLYIGYLAYRGLRRHDSTQMLVLSIGMILLFGIAYGISIVGTVLLEFRVLPLPSQDVFRLGVRIVQFVGLVCIAYSLYIGREARR